MNYFLFEVKVMEKQFNLSDPEGKTQFYREIARKLLEFPEELERNNYMESISRLYQIQFEDLRKMVNHMALAGTAQTIKPRTEIRSKEGRPGRRRENRPETDAYLADLLSFYV